VVGGGSSEHKGITHKHGATWKKYVTPTMYPFFIHFVYAGLVLPFFDFFWAVLEHYQIQALHLHPNSIMSLALVLGCPTPPLLEPAIQLPNPIDLGLQFSLPGTYLPTWIMVEEA
jgi:hypothetical protein